MRESDGQRGGSGKNRVALGESSVLKVDYADQGGIERGNGRPELRNDSAAGTYAVSAGVDGRAGEVEAHALRLTLSGPGATPRPTLFPGICQSFFCASRTWNTSTSSENFYKRHEYWRMKQLAVDLVILNERQFSYVQELQVAIETLVRTSRSSPLPGTEHRPGRVVLLRADLIAAETRGLLPSVARVVLVAQRGSLSEQLDRMLEPVAPVKPARRRVVPR